MIIHQSRSQLPNRMFWLITENFFQLRNDVKSLAENNDNLKFTLETIANPSLRTKIFTIADALIGGTSVTVSSGGGGSTSDLRWDGRQPNEEDDVYRRRCLFYAFKAVNIYAKESYRRR